MGLDSSGRRAIGEAQIRGVDSVEKKTLLETNLLTP